MKKTIKKTLEETVLYPLEKEIRSYDPVILFGFTVGVPCYFLFIWCIISILFG